MKPKVLSLIIVVVAVFILAAIGYWKATSGVIKEKNPRIDVSPETFDFGTISFGVVAKQTFTVRNTGDAVLEIKRVSTSCGCTTARVGQTIIRPRESTELSVEYDTAAMGSGPHGKGKQERIIYLKSNDPLHPQTEIYITAFVQ